MDGPSGAVLVGAGFSSTFGVPTMRPFFERFLDFSRRQYPNLAPAIEAMVGDLGPDADLESLLSKLNAAVEVGAGLPPGFDTSELADWIQSATALRSHLLSYIVELCEQFDRDKAVQLCSQFVRDAAETRIILFTTNYDRVIEYVCTSTGVRFADGFAHEPGELANPWNAEFRDGLPLAKLHGSVTWYVDRSERSTFLRLDRGYPLPGPDFHLSRLGRALEPLMIVPTLEKQALGPPYNYLLNFLTDTLSRTRLLILIGTSLRDEHIVGSFAYHSSRLSVLIVGPHAEGLVARLRGIMVDALSVSAEEFLTVSGDSLRGLVEEAVGVEDPATRAEMIHAFAETERHRIAEWRGLTDTQRRLVKDLERKDLNRQLAALESLRGVAHSEVMEATLPLLGAESVELRSSAAGSLGLAREDGAVQMLERLAIEDPDRVVRLEAALALQRIATPSANEALDRLKAARPEEAATVGL